MPIAKKKKVGTKKPITKKSSLKKPLIKKPVLKKTAAVDKAPTDGSKIKVEMYPNKSYAEEYQATGFHYAFVSSPEKGSKMCHWWVKCRDFLQDALRNQLTGRNDAIYSFAYRPASDPEVDTARTRIMVKRVPTPSAADGQKEFDEMMTAGLRLVNHYEKKYGFKPPSNIVKVDHTSYPYLFIGPGVWSQGPVMIAIYTFLIRIGFFKPQFKDDAGLMKAYEDIIKNGNHGQQTNDTRYLKTVYKNLDPALEHLEDHLFKPKGWKKGDKVLFHDSPMNSFHHHSGIVSLSQFNTPEKGLNDRFRKIFAGK